MPISLLTNIWREVSRCPYLDDMTTEHELHGSPRTVSKSELISRWAGAFAHRFSVPCHLSGALPPEEPLLEEYLARRPSPKERVPPCVRTACHAQFQISGQISKTSETLNCSSRELIPPRGMESGHNADIILDRPFPLLSSQLPSHLEYVNRLQSKKSRPSYPGERFFCYGRARLTEISMRNTSECGT